MIKSLQCVQINLLLLIELYQTSSWQKHYTNQLLENLKHVNYIHPFYIWSADLVDMQLISKYNKGIRFLLYVVDIYSKYTWIVPLKDKEIAVIDASQEM